MNKEKETKYLACVKQLKEGGEYYTESKSKLMFFENDGLYTISEDNIYFEIKNGKFISFKIKDNNKIKNLKILDGYTEDYRSNNGLARIKFDSDRDFSTIIKKLNFTFIQDIIKI